MNRESIKDTVLNYVVDALSCQKRKSCVCHLFNYFVLTQDFLLLLRSNFNSETLQLNMEGKEVKIVLEIAWLKQLMQVVEGKKVHCTEIDCKLAWGDFSSVPVLLLISSSFQECIFQIFWRYNPRSS